MKGRAALIFAFIHCFLGFFGMRSPPSHRSLLTLNPRIHMNESINIKFMWNSDEAIAAHTAHRKHTFRKPFRFAANIIAILAIFAGIYRVVAIGWALFPIALFAGGFYWLFLRRYDMAWTVRRRFKKRPDKDKIVNWTISENELHTSVEGIGEATVKWESFSKVVHAQEGFLFYANNQIYNWFPHSGFSNEKEIFRVKDLAKSKVAKFIELVKQSLPADRKKPRPLKRVMPSKVVGT